MRRGIFGWWRKTRGKRTATGTIDCLSRALSRPARCARASPQVEISSNRDECWRPIVSVVISRLFVYISYVQNILLLLRLITP
ncbi:hypothetical protein PENSPDRAFT_101659 [Peniophora sp. CONT]|nr:hypothetical protein PENSPDRAFT_101659 [Peniophora sp. CONT]